MIISKRPGGVRRCFSCRAVTVLGVLLGLLFASLVGFVPSVNAATLSMSTTQAQWDLAGLGYLPFAGVDGAVGPQTQNSTRAFQSDACLAVEGIVGANTSAALVGKVMKVQSVVGVAQDGGFGPATEQAVKNWQVAHQLPADGQAGSQTMSRMGIVRSTCSAPPRAPSPVPPAQSSTAQAQWDLAGLG